MSLNKKVEKSFLVSWALAVGISTLQIGYAIGVFNPLMHQMRIQLNWNGKPSIFYGLITSMIPLGAALGSLLSNPLSKFGSKSALFCANFILILGCSLTQCLNLVSICLGRAVYGIAIGVFGVVVPIFLRDMSPLELTAPLGAVTTITYNGGFLVACLLGYLVPERDSSSEANNETVWRLMFAIPIILTVF